MPSSRWHTLQLINIDKPHGIDCIHPLHKHAATTFCNAKFLLLRDEFLYKLLQYISAPIQEEYEEENQKRGQSSGRRRLHFLSKLQICPCKICNLHLLFLFFHPLFVCLNKICRDDELGGSIQWIETRRP